MSSFPEDVPVPVEQLREGSWLNLWFQNDFQCLAARERCKPFFKLFQRQLARDKAAVEKVLAQARSQNVAHDFPGFEDAAADDAVDGQATEDHIAGEIHFHFAFGQSEEDE